MIYKEVQPQALLIHLVVPKPSESQHCTISPISPGKVSLVVIPGPPQDNYGCDLMKIGENTFKTHFIRGDIGTVLNGLGHCGGRGYSSFVHHYHYINITVTMLHKP